MAKIKFNGKSVRKLMERNTGEDVLFVKDEGIYLLNRGQHTGNGGLIVYANGYDPKKHDRMEVWDKALAAVGGDDFVEVFESSVMKGIAEAENFISLIVNITETQISLISEELAPNN